MNGRRAESERAMHTLAVNNARWRDLAAAAGVAANLVGV
jgi:hypothetical protein